MIGGPCTGLMLVLSPDNVEVGEGMESSLGGQYVWGQWLVWQDGNGGQGSPTVREEKEEGFPIPSLKPLIILTH